MYHHLNKLAIFILPSWIYRRLIGDWQTDGIKKYFINTSWIFIAKLCSLTVSFFVIAFVARYLGPENFGRLSYAQSFVAIFSVFAALGIDQILYRDLIAKPEKETELLGTAFFARLFFGTVTLVVTVIFAHFLNDEPILTWLTFLIALSFLFQPFGVIAHAFNARVLARYPSYIAIGIAFIIPVLKLVVIFFDKGILFLASLLAVEALLFALGYIYMYQKILRATPFSWRVSRTMFIELFSRSWPLFLASLSGYIYGRIDQVMIQHFVDSTSVGLYDIAVRLTEYLGFVPGIIIASLFPAIMNARSRTQEEFKKRFISLSFLCLGIASLSALILYAIAPFVINLLFGEAFSVSASLLRVYVWSTVGTVAIILIQQYFVAENKSLLFLSFTLFGAILNVVLNLFMIPTFGVYGGAVATLITLASVVLVFITWFWWPSQTQTN